MRHHPLVALSVVALLSTSVAASASATTSTFNVTLTPEAAAPDASGHAMIKIDSETGEVCYSIKWRDVPAPVTGGHIHATGGAIVVSLFGGPLGEPSAYPGDKFKVSGCVSGDPATISAILADPSSYYVNLHIGTTFTSVLTGYLV